MNTRHGIYLVVVAEIMFAFSWAIIKWVGARMPVFEVVFFRALLSLVFLIPIMLAKKISFRGKNYRLLFLRSLFGSLAAVTSFYAVSKMNLGNAITLLNTLPLFVALLAPLLIGERFGKKTFYFILIAFVGIVLIIKPTLDIFHNVALIGLSSGLFAALAMIYLRKLSFSDGATVVTFYFTFFMMITSFPFMISKFVLPTYFEAALFVLLGILITFAQLLMTKGYGYGRAATMASFAYVSVVVSYLLSVLFWDDIPDTWSIIGGTMVIFSGIAITYLANIKTSESPT